MNSIEIIINNPEKLENHRKHLEDFITGVLSSLEIDNWQMGVVFTDNSGILEYNKQWRNIDAPTDVISFALNDGPDIPLPPGEPVEAGDIIISSEKVLQNAFENNVLCTEELLRVIIHGILHLNGMDHPGDDYSSGMLKLQEELLSKCGGGYTSIELC
jgi:probable rRNA maturation factor